MALPSDKVTPESAALMKALGGAGLHQQDIGALLCVAGARVSEVLAGKRFSDVPPAPLHDPRTVAAVYRAVALCGARMTRQIETVVGIEAMRGRLQTRRTRLHLSVPISEGTPE